MPLVPWIKATPALPLRPVAKAQITALVQVSHGPPWQDSSPKQLSRCGAESSAQFLTSDVCMYIYTYTHVSVYIYYTIVYM